jgi:hypothetical protein
MSGSNDDVGVSQNFLSGTSDGYNGFREGSEAGSETGALNFLVKSALSEVATSHVVKVVKVRSNGEVAAPTSIDVQIVVHQIDGDGNAHPHGTIFNVPYHRAQNGTNGIIMDPKEGDIGVIVCASRDISSVKANKGDASVPGSHRRHDLADALYVGTVIAKNAPEQYVQFTDEGMAMLTPNNMDVTAKKDMSISVTGTLTINASTIKLIGPIQQTGGSITSNGKHIDDTHIHKDTQPGGGKSGVPFI